MIDQILAHNRKFVEEKRYEAFRTDKFPKTKIAVLTCMDTRLIQLLPAALGFGLGDIKIIKNAGAIIPSMFDSTMRSLLISIYELGVTEIMIIGHTQCGVQGMDSREMIHQMRERGITDDHIRLMRHCGVDLDKWLAGFSDTTEAVLDTVDLVLNHPLLPADVIVRGYIMDSVTGELTPVMR